MSAVKKYLCISFSIACFFTNARAESDNNSTADSERPKVVSVNPPSDSKMALMSELKITFDQPMVPEEFNVVDASLDKKKSVWSYTSVLSPYCSYDPNNNTFTLLLALPNNWNGQIRLSHFKNLKGIEANDVVLDYHTLRDGFSQDMQARFEKERQSAELRDLLKKIKEARTNIFSLSEKIKETMESGSYKKTEEIIIKMNKDGRFFADMNGVFDNPWSIGSDGNQCWYYYKIKDGDERLSAADFKDVNEKNISICDLFGLSKSNVEETIKSLNIEYAGTDMLDGRLCYIIRSWVSQALSSYTNCSIDEWWIDGKSYMPVRMISDSVKTKRTRSYIYDSINMPIPDWEFRPDSFAGKLKAQTEPLGEGYNMRFINIIDGTSYGYFGIGWGKRGPKGTSSSGMN